MKKYVHVHLKMIRKDSGAHMRNYDICMGAICNNLSNVMINGHTHMYTFGCQEEQCNVEAIMDRGTLLECKELSEEFYGDFNSIIAPLKNINTYICQSPTLRALLSSRT